MVFLILSSFISLFGEEIKSFFLVQLNIKLPIFEILIAIFATGMIIGVVAFAIEGVLSLRKNKIKFYNSREELPSSLNNRVLQTKEEIIFIGATLEKIIGEKGGTIKKTIEKGVHMKFLILNSESELISELDESIIATKNAITSQLERICKIKSELSESNKDKCEIRTYDFPLFHSIIISDRKTEDAMISVEFRLLDSDTDSRPSIYIYKKKQEEVFAKYLKHYKFILKKSVEYQCKNKQKLSKE